MKLTRFELKKIICTPIVWIVFIAVIILNVFSILTGGEQRQYAANSPAFHTNIQKLQKQYAYFSGPITQEWIDRYQQEAEAILNDPQYRVGEDEVEEIVQTYMSQYGYKEETVRENLYLFLNEQGKTEYEKYEDVQVASMFYINAKKFGDRMAEYYQSAYPGRKGTVLASDTQEKYNYLATEYTANYNYDFGYQKIRNMMTTYPYTIGVVTLIALAPLFSSEYVKRTDALLLSSKNGKQKLAYTKIKAGLFVAFFAWGIITILNLILIFSLYGLTGWEAFWQNWLTDVAPFPWTQGQVTVIAIITSLLGSLFFAQIVILVSSISKNQFVSIVTSATILLFPMFDFAFTNSYFINMLYNFLPTRIMMGIRIWQGYDLLYFVGHTVPYQYIAIIFAVIVSACICPLTAYSFIKHQVGN